MPLGYISDELLTTIRNIGGLTDASSSGTADADLLRHCSEALRTKIFPEVMKLREEYFVVTTRMALTAGTTHYRLPTRATGNRLRDLFYITTSGTRRRLRVTQREKLDGYSTTNAPANAYFLEGNNVVLSSPSDGIGSLEMAFFFAPSDLVLTADARKITIIAGNTITLSTAKPTAWTTFNTFDIHSSVSGADIKNWGVSAASFPATDTITFAAGVLDGSTFGTKSVEVGDWICLAGECVIPPLPRELHPTLARAVALRIAEANADQVKIKLHAANLTDDIKNLSSLLNDRNEGDPLVISGERGHLWDTSPWW